MCKPSKYLISILLLYISFFLNAQNYISIGMGVAEPTGAFSSGGNTNVYGIFKSFLNPTSDNSGTSLLIPATTGQYYGIDGALYFTKSLGVSVNGRLSSYTADEVAIKNAFNEIVVEGVNNLIPTIIGAQDDPVVTQVLQQLRLSSRVENTKWNSGSVFIGPTICKKFGRITLDARILGGYMDISTPEVTATVTFNVSFLSGPLFEFRQSSISKGIFAYQIGYGVKYSITDYLGLRLSTDFVGASTNYDLTVSSSFPAKSTLEFIAGQNNINFPVPVDQHTSVKQSLNSINFGLGLCFQFGNIFKGKLTPDAVE